MTRRALSSRTKGQFLGAAPRPLATESATCPPGLAGASFEKTWDECVMVDGSWAGPRGPSLLWGGTLCLPCPHRRCMGGRSLKNPALGHPASRLLLSQLWSSKKQRKLEEKNPKETNNNKERKEKTERKQKIRGHEIKDKTPARAATRRRPVPRGRPRGPPRWAGGGQTDRYCIYWVWLLFSVCFTPDNPPQSQLEDRSGCWGQGGGRRGAPPQAGLQERGACESFGKKAGGCGARRGAWGVGRQCDPEPGGRQPAGGVGRGVWVEAGWPPRGARAHP